MTENDSEPSSLSPREQAIKWFVHFESNEATPDDRHQFVRWLRENPVHRQEYDQVSHTWRDIDQIKPLWAKEHGWVKNQSHAADSVPPLSNSQPGLGWGILGPALGMAAAVMIFFLWWVQNSPPPVQFYQTAKGEQQTLPLADGSTIVINTDSKLSVQMASHERRITLQQGEALFTVAHDEKRPFTVLTGNGVVRDIGTQFVIRKFPDKVRVSVLEGFVEVDFNDPHQSLSGRNPQRLGQGEEVQYTVEGRMSPVNSFDPQAAIAWTEGNLTFHDQPLETVLKEWARYRREEIRLLDPALRTLPVNGKFNIDNVESFFQALADVLSIKAYHINPRLVILERKSSS